MNRTQEKERTMEEVEEEYHAILASVSSTLSLL